MDVGLMMSWWKRRRCEMWPENLNVAARSIIGIDVALPWILNRFVNLNSDSIRKLGRTNYFTNISIFDSLGQKYAKLIYGRLKIIDRYHHLVW